MENSKKRAREDELADSSPEEAKRARPDLVFDILDDDDDVSSGEGYLDDVIKSLEEEISPPAQTPSPDPALLDLGYLLEASDDELGLPPTVGSDTPGSDGGDAVEVVDERIWEFEDEMSVGIVGYECFGFGFGFGSGFVEPGAEDAGSGFDYSVYDDLLWRPESQPTA